MDLREGPCRGSHTMLPIDPGEALATLATLPPDAGVEAYAAAWPLAVAAASAPRSHALFRSPGAAYSWLGYGADGVLVGVRPLDDKVYATDRFAEGVVVTELATLRADHLAVCVLDDLRGLGPARRPSLGLCAIDDRGMLERRVRIADLLERHGAAEPGIAGLGDLAHPAACDLGAVR